MVKLTEHVQVFLEPLGSPERIGVRFADGQTVTIEAVDENEIGVLVTQTDLTEAFGDPESRECVWSRTPPTPPEPKFPEEEDDGADEPAVQDGEA